MIALSCEYTREGNPNQKCEATCFMTQSTPTAALIDGIKFGTDGWRGVIAAEFTFERVCYVAAIAAQVLAENYSAKPIIAARLLWATIAVSCQKNLQQQ